MIKELFRKLINWATRAPTETRIKAGARAYSAPYGIDWGLVPDNLIGVPVTIGSKWREHSRIDFPTWPSGKPFWVKDFWIEEVVVEPPPATTNYLEPITVHMDDGSVWRTIGDSIPLERIL